MNLAEVLDRRRADTGATDPDSLHGLLVMRECRRPLADISAQSGIKKTELIRLLDKAAAGHAGRVPPVGGASVVRDIPIDDGLFSNRWMRALIAGMLKPDGMTVEQVETAIEIIGMKGTGRGVALVGILRAELRIFGLRIQTDRNTKTAPARYRIIGNDAWKMQRIIANGWVL